MSRIPLDGYLKTRPPDRIGGIALGLGREHLWLVAKARLAVEAQTRFVRVILV